MKPVHDWGNTEPGEVVGLERPSTPEPLQPADDHDPEVETSADMERGTEEAGYGYGV